MGAGRYPHDLLVELARRAGQRPVHGVDERRLQLRAEREAHQAGVVVHDVELAVALEAAERVLKLPEGLADPLARRAPEGVRELRARLRVAGREERDLVARVGEAVREQGDDPLDAAVAGRRHREPDGTEDRDLHDC